MESMKLKKHLFGFEPGTPIELVDIEESRPGFTRVQIVGADETVIQCWAPDDAVDRTPTIYVGEPEPEPDVADEIAATVLKSKPRNAKELAAIIRDAMEPYEVKHEMELADSNRIRRKWRGLCVGQINRIKYLESLITSKPAEKAGGDDATEPHMAGSARPRRRLPLRNIVSIARKLRQFYEDDDLETSIAEN